MEYQISVAQHATQKALVITQSLAREDIREYLDAAFRKLPHCWPSVVSRQQAHRSPVIGWTRIPSTSRRESRYPTGRGFWTGTAGRTARRRYRVNGACRLYENSRRIPRRHRMAAGAGYNHR